MCFVLFVIEFFINIEIASSFVLNFGKNYAIFTPQSWMPLRKVLQKTLVCAYFQIIFTIAVEANANDVDINSGSDEFIGSVF